MRTVAATSSRIDAISSTTPGSDPAPGLGADGPEDVDRLLGPGELEEERLQQDAGHDQLQQPADDGLGA